MKKLQVLLGFSLMSLACTSVWAVDDVNKSKVDQAMATFMQQNAIPGAAVSIYDQGKTYTYTYGVTNLETKKPVTANTIFEVGSLTKLMTTLLIAEGASRIVHYQANEDVPPQLKLDGTLPTYLPAYAQNAAFSNITLLNLATFSASLPFSLPDGTTTDTQIFSYLNSWKPPYPVGSQWQYSNASIGLLGAVLQSQYHQPIDAIFQQMIFTPLHMTSSGILLSDEQKTRYAQGYSATGDAAPPTKYGFFPSAGDLKSTITDLSYFLAAAAGAPDTNPEINIGMQVAQTPRAQLPDGVLVGMGWQLIALDAKDLLDAPKEMNLGPLPLTWLSQAQQQFNPNFLIDKTGATEGFRAYIAVIPSQQKGIVLLMNRYIPNGVLVDMGRKLLLDLPKDNNKQAPQEVAAAVTPSKIN